MSNDVQHLKSLLRRVTEDSEWSCMDAGLQSEILAAISDESRVASIAKTPR